MSRGWSIVCARMISLMSPGLNCSSPEGSTFRSGAIMPGPGLGEQDFVGIGFEIALEGAAALQVSQGRGEAGDQIGVPAIDIVIERDGFDQRRAGAKCS